MALTQICYDKLYDIGLVDSSRWLNDKALKISWKYMELSKLRVQCTSTINSNWMLFMHTASSWKVKVHQLNWIWPEEKVTLVYQIIKSLILKKHLKCKDCLYKKSNIVKYEQSKEIFCTKKYWSLLWKQLKIVVCLLITHPERIITFMKSLPRQFN